MDFEKILQYAVEKETSDIHLSPNLSVIFRINGILVPFGEKVKSAEIHNLSLNILNQAQQEILEIERNVDFVYNSKTNHRFRGNCYYTRDGLVFAFRLIPSIIPPFESLNLPNYLLKDLLKLKQGLVLVVGPTGHGKSTTLASLLKNRSDIYSEHIITIEDPIEFVIKSGKSIIHQRSQGRDVKSFDNGLRSALREDPDVLMVGEMRDLETISAALTAAETGHLVFSTLHTNNAAETIDRIIDVFPSDQQSQVRMQLAGCLTTVVSQRLLPSLEGKRILAYEIMISNYAIKNQIRKGNIFQIANTIQTDSSGKMILFDQSLANLVLKRKISLKVALENSISEDQLKSILEVNGYEEYSFNKLNNREKIEELNLDL